MLTRGRPTDPIINSKLCFATLEYHDHIEVDYFNLAALEMKEQKKVSKYKIKRPYKMMKEAWGLTILVNSNK